MPKHKLHFLLAFSIYFLVSSCEYDRVAIKPLCELNPVLISLDNANSNLSVACGAENAEIMIVGNGGTSSLEYSINEGPFGASNTFNQLGAGAYTIIARDAINFCESAPLALEVINEGGLAINITSKRNTECGKASGEIAVAQTNGVPPIEYKLDNGAFQSENIFSQLSTGNFKITAKDANGCEATIDNIAITSDVSFAADIKNIIVTNCAVTGCHSGSQPPNFTDNQNIFNNAARIKSRTSSGSMPPSGRTDLTQNQIDLIACWVEDGALNN